MLVTPVIRTFVAFVYVPGSSSRVNVTPSIVIACPSTEPPRSTPPAEGETKEDIRGLFSVWVLELAAVPAVVAVIVNEPQE